MIAIVHERNHNEPYILYNNSTQNIPNLLQRCLDSIPKREDMEVIVVDDNCDTEIIDFDHFRGNSQKEI